MFRTLLESGASPTRRAGGTIVSIALHTAAIALAIVATARATAVKPANETPHPPLVYQVLPTHAERPPVQGGKRLPGTYIGPALPRCECTVPPVAPTGLPPIDASSIGTQLPSIVFSGGGALGGGVVDRAGLGRLSSDVFTWRLVDKAAAPRAGNPAPVYPTALRAAQIEGTVLARFVVDSGGRAEPGSIEFPEATHAQFAEAVRQSLLKSRYLPAMIDGRPVRQLAEQRFAFTLVR